MAFRSVTQMCKNSKKHRTDIQKIHVSFQGVESLLVFETVSFPLPSSSLASWDALTYTQKSTEQRNEVFLTGILGADPYCSTVIGLAGWHVANTVYTRAKNVRFPGCVCDSGKDKGIIDDVLMGKILRSQQGATPSSPQRVFAFLTIIFYHHCATQIPQKKPYCHNPSAPQRVS